jgi:hypothetical protein
MRIVFISANLGNIDLNYQKYHIEQNMPIDYYYFTEENFQLRTMAVHPRLQAKVPKMLGWDMVFDYDLYIWADSCITFTKPNSVEWLIEKLGNNDMCFFRHQDKRVGIESELVFMEEHMKGLTGNTYAMNYLNERYSTEPMREQVERYLSDKDFTDNALYSAGLFIYKNTEKVKAMMKDWYYQCARYSVQDQLSLPYVIQKFGIKVSMIDDNITDNSYTKYWNRRIQAEGKWDNIYSNLTKDPSSFLYGDTETYRIGADILKDCMTVEDWGTGAGGFKRYRPDTIGVDGSKTPHADIITDLTIYHSNVEGIFLRHVIEHNYEWKQVLINALNSASKKIVIILFTPFSAEETIVIPGSLEENRNFGIDVPSISINRDEFYKIVDTFSFRHSEEIINSNTRYGQEIIITLFK